MGADNPVVRGHPHSKVDVSLDDGRTAVELVVKITFLARSSSRTTHGCNLRPAGNNCILDPDLTLLRKSNLLLYAHPPQKAHRLNAITGTQPFSSLLTIVIRPPETLWI